MEPLKEMNCRRIDKAESAFSESEIKHYLGRLNTVWDVESNQKIKKRFPFENFKRGMIFAQEVAMLAEQQNHHPDLCIHYTHVDVELGTHDVGGLSVNDFIMAAKIDAV